MTVCNRVYSLIKILIGRMEDVGIIESQEGDFLLLYINIRFF